MKIIYIQLPYLSKLVEKIVIKIKCQENMRGDDSRRERSTQVLLTWKVDGQVVTDLAKEIILTHKPESGEKPKKGNAINSIVLEKVIRFGGRKKLLKQRYGCYWKKGYIYSSV